MCLRRYKQCAGICRGLHPPRNIGRFAEQIGIFTGACLNHHRTRIDADSWRKLWMRCRVIVQLRDCFEDCEAGANRILRIVLVYLRPAEIRHYAVAAVLPDMAPVPFDGLNGCAMVTSDDLPPCLGVTLPREAGRIHQVAKQHCQMPPLAGWAVARLWHSGLVIRDCSLGAADQDSLRSGLLSPGDKTVAFGWSGRHKARSFRVIIERATNLAHGGVDAALDVDKDTLAPDPFEDFLAGHDLPAAFDQKTQQFEWDAFEMHDPAVAAKLAGVGVQFEVAESLYSRHFRRHWRSSG